MKKLLAFTGFHLAVPLLKAIKSKSVKQPDRDRQAKAEAKRQRKAAKRMAEQERGKV